MKKLTEASSARRRKALQSLAQVSARLCTGGQHHDQPGEAKRPATQRAEKRRRMRVWEWLGVLGLMGS